MIPFNKNPNKFLLIENYEIADFSSEEAENIDKRTVDSFGEEWSKFDEFTDTEINKIGDDYFDILPNIGVEDMVVLDVGCGTGRWAKYLAEKVKFIECIDPSRAVESAVKLLRNTNNIRITKADVNNIPFDKGQFDLVHSLGVLHHIPDTEVGIKKCVDMVKPGGYFLVYLYYNLDNRGMIYRSIFRMSNILRRLISQAPKRLKFIICDLLAIIFYLPLISAARLFKLIGLKKVAHKIPLSYYTKTSWNIIRNDSLDRFGTPLEKRFSKAEIEKMLLNAGLTNLKFSENPPYWHAIGQK